MEWRRVELKDAEELNKYFQVYNNGYNCMDLGGLFGWRDHLDAHYVIIDDTLIIKIKIRGNIDRFCLPIGKNPDSAIKWLIEYTEKNNIELTFFPISHNELELIDKYFVYEIKHFENTGDYIFDANSLKTMGGRKLHGQKNHLNYFLKNYSDCVIVDIDKTNAQELKAFIQEFKNIEKENNVYMYKAEIEYGNEVLDNLDIYKFSGIAVRYKSKIIGFILGEEIKETVFFHIMKIDKNYRGVSQFLIVNYLKRCSDNVKYVNMEDDARDEDLKYTKLCYHPLKMQDVNLVIVKEVKKVV